MFLFTMLLICMSDMHALVEANLLKEEILKTGHISVLFLRFKLVKQSYSQLLYQTQMADNTIVRTPCFCSLNSDSRRAERAVPLLS